MIEDYYKDNYGSTPLLTTRQELILARQVQEGSTETATAQQRRRAMKAKDQMIRANLRLAVYMAHKLMPRCKTLTLTDLVQEGVFGLNRAVELFDPSRGYKFSTYAYRWVFQAMARAIHCYDRTIRLPVHVRERMGKVAAEAHKALLNNEPITRDQLAERAGLKADALRLADCTWSVASLNEKPLDGTELGDLLVTPSPEPSLLDELGLDHEILQTMIDRLPEAYGKVLRLHYGLSGDAPMSLQAIGKQMGLSRERIRQLRNKGENRLRIMLADVLEEPA